jgi:predicted transcriptional regulator
MTSDSRLVMTSVRLDRELHERLRKIAYDHNRSLHSLLIEGARIAENAYSTMADTQPVQAGHHAARTSQHDNS